MRQEASDLLRKIRSCDMDSPFVFISYASEDYELVYSDVIEFQRRGYNVWVDEKNLDKTNDSWHDDALKAIQDIDCMLLVFYVSSHSMISRGCALELYATVDEETQRAHFGKIKFMAVDLEHIGDIEAFSRGLHDKVIRDRAISKEERTARAKNINDLFNNFFNGNNEKVRIHPKDEEHRKLDYFEDILSAFPGECKICDEQPLDEAVEDEKSDDSHERGESRQGVERIEGPEAGQVNASVGDDWPKRILLERGQRGESPAIQKCKKQVETVLVSYSARIAVGYEFTVGLRSDGTVLACGDNAFGQCRTSSWRDVVAVAAGFNYTIGLRSDGTVLACGDNAFGQCDTLKWCEMVSVAAGDYHTVGLRSDGTVPACGNDAEGQCRTSTWRDVVAVTAGNYHTVGLRSDGTVLACGANGCGQCDVLAWRDVVAVAAGCNHTVGLRSDGTVLACGAKGEGQCRTSTWRDVVAVAAGCNHTVGLRSDGTVLACGAKGEGQCRTSTWRDVVAVAAGNYHTVGLRSDGTVLACGRNDCGQCDTSSWRLLNFL